MRKSHNLRGMLYCSFTDRDVDTPFSWVIINVLMLTPPRHPHNPCSQRARVPHCHAPRSLLHCPRRLARSHINFQGAQAVASRRYGLDWHALSVVSDNGKSSSFSSMNASEHARLEQDKMRHSDMEPNISFPQQNIKQTKLDGKFLYNII